MDWKGLVQFALRGSSDLETYTILLVCVSIGLFFAISGASKLFVFGRGPRAWELVFVNMATITTMAIITAPWAG